MANIFDDDLDFGEDIDMRAEEKAIKHKKFFVFICLASVVVAMGIFVLLINGFINRRFQNYEIISSVERQDTNTEQYVCPDGRLIKYSKDGISEITISGKTLWTGSYNMNNPKLVQCGTYVLVADIGGKEAYIYNGEDSGTEIAVDYEIRQACVSRQGVVALLLEDTSSNIISIYNPYDVSSSLLVEIPTNVEDGYPVTISLSPDGTSLVASYVCVTAGKAETRVAFYNFTETGKNSDCLVGAQIYEDALITDIRFMDDNQVCLFGDKGFYIWEHMKQPEQSVQQEIKQNIKSVFSNERYIGLIVETEKEKVPYQLQIYNEKGDRVTAVGFDYEYDSVELTDDEILMHSAKECTIFRLNGVQRLHCTVEEGVAYFFKGSRKYRYYILDDSTIKEVKLSKK